MVVEILVVQHALDHAADV